MRMTTRYVLIVSPWPWQEVQEPKQAGLYWITELEARDKEKEPII